MKLLMQIFRIFYRFCELDELKETIVILELILIKQSLFDGN